MLQQLQYFLRLLMEDLTDENGKPHKKFRNGKYPYVRDRIKFLEAHIECFQRVVSEHILA